MVTQFSEFSKRTKGNFSFNMYSTIPKCYSRKLEKPKTGSMNFQEAILVLKPTQKPQVNVNNK